MKSQAISNKEVQQLIQVAAGEAWTTSLVISDQFGRAHKNVLQSLDSLIADGTLERGLDIEPTLRQVSGPNGAAREERAYRLNERAALIAMPFIGGKKSREGQKKLVDAFLAMRRIVKQQENYRATAEWIEARNSGKAIRLTTTDIIQEFVGYARAQGSKSADMYFMQLTKMEYRALFLINAAVGNGFRERLNTMQLLNLATAESIAQQALRDGMDDGLHYKAIYQQAKERIEQLGRLIGKTLPGTPMPRRLAA